MPLPGGTDEPADGSGGRGGSEPFGNRACRPVAFLAGLGNRSVVLPDRVLPARFSRSDDLRADARFSIGREEPGKPVGVLLLLLRGDAGAGGRADRFVGSAQTALLGSALRRGRHIPVRRNIGLYCCLYRPRDRGRRDGGGMACAPQTRHALVSGAPVRDAGGAGPVLRQCRRASGAGSLTPAHRTVRLEERRRRFSRHPPRRLRRGLADRQERPGRSRARELRTCRPARQRPAHDGRTAWRLSKGLRLSEYLAHLSGPGRNRGADPGLHRPMGGHHS